MEKIYKTDKGFEFSISWPNGDDSYAFPRLTSAFGHGLPFSITRGELPDGRKGKLIFLICSEKKWRRIWHPEAVADIEAEYARREALEHDRRANTVNVMLSTRGWGAYPSVYIKVDRRKPVSGYLAIARTALEAGGNDVDRRNQTEAELIATIQAALDNAEAEEKKAASEKKIKETRKNEVRQAIDRCETEKTSQADENGQVTEYLHAITLPDGEILKFVERNFGEGWRLISPAYKITPEAAEPGGLREGGMWVKPGEEGWRPVRPLTDNERAAYHYILIFGRFAGVGAKA